MTSRLISLASTQARAIGKTIEEWEKKDWHFHSHEAFGAPTMVNHYLLFEGEIKWKASSAEAASAVAT